MNADVNVPVAPSHPCGPPMSNVLAARQELELLDDEANVYKLVGPALIKQDLVEAKSNVSKRVEYIQNEMYVTRSGTNGAEDSKSSSVLTRNNASAFIHCRKRIESNVKGIESKQSQMQEEILGLQQQLKSSQ